MQLTTMRRAAISVLASVALLFSATPAAAQWAATGVGVAEWDTNESLFLLAGISTGPTGPGVRPVFGINASRLSFRPGTETVTVTSIRPSVGLRNNYTGGSAQARVGYAFTSRETTVAAPATGDFVDTQDGVVVTTQVDHWGTGGPLGWQFLGAYNFGSEALWTRGRVTTRVGAPDPRQIRFGGEVAYYTGRGFRAVQPGVVAEWHAGNGFILGAGVGRKFVNQGDDATYFRLETVLPILR